MPSINIRQATLKDIPQLVTLHKNVKEIHLLKHFTYNDAYFKQFIKSRSLLALVAEEKKVIVGSATAEFESVHGHTWLVAIVVHAKHKGKGISGLLFKEVEKYAKKKKHKAICFLVYDWNKHMQTVVEHYNYKKAANMLFYAKEL